jgi:SEC-C motif
VALPDLPITVNELVSAIAYACESEPLTVEEIIDELADHFGDRLPEEIDAFMIDDLLDDEPTFLHLADERIVCQFGLWSQFVLTHRLTQEEIDSGVIEVGFDFIELPTLNFERSFAYNCEANQVIFGTSGWNFGLRDQENDRHLFDFFGPEGWLASFQAGDLVGVRVGLKQHEWVGKVAESDVDDEIGGAVVHAFREATAHVTDAPVDFSDIVFGYLVEVMANQMGSNQPLLVMPPLSTILTEAGLESHDGEWIAPVGFDFDAWESRRAERIREGRTGSEGQLGPDAKALAAQLSTAGGHGKANSVSFDVAAFRRSFVAAAADLNHGAQLQLDTELAQMFHLNSGRNRAWIAVVRALIVRHVDPQLTEPTSAEAIDHYLSEARRADPRLLDVINEMAWEAFRRNDLGKTRTLIREWGNSGGVDAGSAKRGGPISLHAHLFLDIDGCIGSATIVRSANALGRNDPCHCGSGRKFKQCCINKPAPLAGAANRGPLLHVALGWYVLRTMPERLAELASPMPGHEPTPEESKSTMDSLGCEDSVVESFLRELSPQLCGPAESAMIRTWAKTPMDLWEIEDTKPGRSLTIRNVRDGAAHEIKSDHMSTVLTAGMYVVARPLPMDVDVNGTVRAHSEWKMFAGCAEVAMQFRESLLEFLDLKPSPTEVYAWLNRQRRSAASPQIAHNTDGDSLMFSTRRWVLAGNVAAGVFDTLSALVPADDIDPVEPKDADVVAAARSIDVSRLILLSDSDVEPYGWTIIDARPFNDLVVGTIQWSNPDLELTANSLKRIVTLGDWLTEQLGLTGEFTTQYESMEDRMYAEDLGLRSESTTSSDADPSEFSFENMSANDRLALQRQIENRWLSEPVPALGGLTPRQAAADPTRRPDLQRLLDGFGTGAVNDYISYDVNRLRQELGLKPKLAGGLSLP